MTLPGPHAMTAQAGAVAAWIPVAMLDPNKRQSFFEASAFQVNPDSVPLYTTPPAAVPVEALEGLVREWDARSRSAFPTDAMLINKHIRELTTLIKERSNG